MISLYVNNPYSRGNFMKHLLVLIVFFFALSSFAQIIEGGSNEPTETFTFAITKNLGSRTVNPAITLFQTDRNDYPSYMRCDRFNGIVYSNSRNETTLFTFENSEKCEIVRRCVQDMMMGSIIYIEVERMSRDLARIVLPLTCSTDPWN